MADCQISGMRAFQTPPGLEIARPTARKMGGKPVFNLKGEQGERGWLYNHVLDPAEYETRP